MAIALFNKHLHLARLLDVSAFLRWWGHGLLLWLPAALRRRLTMPGARLIVIADSNEISLFDERGDNRRELARFQRGELSSGQNTAQAPKPGERQVVLRLDAHQALCTTVTLPLAAESNLRQVVGFEIDRLTPFNADKVFYDIRLQEREPQNRILRARLCVVLRNVLSPLLAQVQSLGLTPDTVEIDGEDSGFNLLPPTHRRRRLRAGQRWRRVLLLLILLTGLAAAALPLWQQRGVVVHLLPLVAAAEQEAEQVLEFRDRLDNAVESSRFLLEKRRQTVLMVDLLNELTVLLPDTTYLEQISVRNGQVELRGQSAEATALISLIEDSELFAQVTFRSPVTKDNRTGRDRFVLTANIVSVPEQPRVD